MQFSGVTMTGGYSVLTGAAPAVPTDAYWANVSFLSETTSTNAQTNNTFLDGSTIGATVSRSGASSTSLTQGSYSPYPANNTTSYSAAANGGSGVFNGDNYLSIPSNAAYAFGTGDFTVEAWVNFSSTAGTIIPICQSDAVGSSSGDKWWFGYSAGALYFAAHLGGTPYASIPFTPSAGTWYNLAVTRSSGTMRLFINGVSGTVTNGNGGLSGYNLGQGGMSIGAMSSPFYLNGYLSDVRLVKGTALYTATYSVATSPLTAVSGTSLLLNYTNAGLYDARANSVLISAGSAQVSTTQAKWSPTSAYFNGSASYLYGYPNTAFAFGTGDFTVEGWVYFNSVSGNQAICQSDAIGNSTNNKWFLNYSGSTNKLQFGTHNAGGFFCTIPFTPSTGTWYYVTAVRSSGTIYMFVDGVSGTVTTTGTPSGYNLSQNGIVVGGVSSPPTNIYLNGYIQDLRLTKGVARYTATFTPPTAALPTSA